MFNTPPPPPKLKLGGIFTRNYPLNFKTEVIQFAVFHFGEGELRFSLSLSPSKLKVKKHPMRASLFSIKTFLDHRELVFFIL